MNTTTTTAQWNDPITAATLVELDRREQAAEAERLARQFAAKYDTAAVREAIAYCESGRLAWVDVAALFAKAYGTAVNA